MVDRGRQRRLRRIVRALAEGGASALELGFPFSDPIADGPTLEAAASRALQHGTQWSDLLDQLRAASGILPTAVMTYANPIWHRGLGPALGAIRDAGGSGLIVPDLSLEEVPPWARAARRAELALPLLAAPTGTAERVERIARTSSGFLYAVSRFGTTGSVPPEGSRTLGPLVRAAHRAAPDLPVLVGFGIRDRRTARRALASGADGMIVGTAVEEQLLAGRTDAALRRWVRGLLPSSVRSEP
jgi:tryptophan synthase alpha chain